MDQIEILPNCTIHISKTLGRSFPNSIDILKMYMMLSIESYETGRNISKLIEAVFNQPGYKRLNSIVSRESDIKRLLSEWRGDQGVGSQKCKGGEPLNFRGT